MRKTLISVLMVALVGATLVSCGSNRSGSTPVVEQVRPTTTVSKYTKAEQDFLSAARTRFPNHSDVELIILGKTACDAIDSYGSLTDTIYAIAMDPSWGAGDARDVGYLFGISIPTFCPKYKAEMNRITGN